MKEGRLRAGLIYLIAALLPILAQFETSAQVSLNEIMVRNNGLIADEDSDYPDWIEIYNGGGAPVNLTGYGISDEPDDLYKWVFPDVVINSGGFLVIWASGKNRTNPLLPLHTNFSLSSSGEVITITTNTGNILDQINVEAVPANITFGRLPDGGASAGLLSLTSQGLSNNSAALFSGIAHPPIFSAEGGYYTENFNLQLSAAHPEEQIIYTLDGSEPDPANIGGSSFMYKNIYPLEPGLPLGDTLYGEIRSIAYTAPIPIYDRSPEPDIVSQKSSTWTGFNPYIPTLPSPKALVVRARTFREGYFPGEIVTHTFFVSPLGADRYSIPVVSLAISEKDLYDYYEGIAVPGFIYDQYKLVFPNTVFDPFPPINFNNFGREEDSWQRTASFTLLMPGENEAVLNQNVGIRIHGSSSRRWPRKSFRIIADSDYGDGNLNHAFFPSQSHDEYSRIVLHNGGNDEFRTNKRDAVAQAILKPMVPVTIEYHPAITYINGEFYGHNNIREVLTDHFFESRFGVDEEDFEAVKASVVQNGDADYFNSISAFVAANPLSLDENFNEFSALVETESMIDVFIGNIYLRNIDWLPNNTYTWRSKDISDFGDIRFRLAFIDLDQSMALFGGAAVSADNYLQTVLVDLENAGDVHTWFKSAMLNEGFKNDFINRFADAMNTYFLPERTVHLADGLQNIYTDHYSEHIARWRRPASFAGWVTQTDVIDSFLSQRTQFQRTHIEEVFGLEGQFQVNLEVSDANHGYIRMNSIDITTATAGVAEPVYPWNGVYFKGVPVKVSAVPYAGFMFSHWEGDTQSLLSEFTQIYTSDTVNLKAIFIPDTTEQKSIIHYWHFNDTTTIASVVQPDSTLTANALISYPGTGPGYIDWAGEGTLLNIQHSEPAGNVLRVRNPSNTRTLLINLPTNGFDEIMLSYATRRTNSGAEFQKLEYRINSSSEWVTVETYPVTLEYMLREFDFSDIPAIQNNPEFAIKITFQGDNAGEDTGNNRFDNIALLGFPTTLSDGLEDLNSAYGMIEVYPNPADNLIHFNVALPGMSDIRIDVFDLSGRNLGELYEGVVHQSAERFEVSTAHLSNGVYLFKLTSAYGTDVKKVVVAR